MKTKWKRVISNQSGGVISPRACTREEGERLLDGQCLFCHAYMLQDGPKDGLSVNVRCVPCGAHFNIGPGVTLCDILSGPEEVDDSNSALCGLDMNAQNQVISNQSAEVISNSEPRPLTKFLVSAVNESGTETIEDEIECEGFEAAWDRLRAAAQKHWPGQVWRPRGVWESAARGGGRSKMEDRPLSARQGLHALVASCLEHRCSSSSAYLRAMLLSLYNGTNKCDLSAVHHLDNAHRRALAALLTGIGMAEDLYDYEIRDAFALLGKEEGLRWFLDKKGQKLTRDEVAYYRRKANSKEVGA